MAGFVENVNTVAASLTPEFIDSVNNAAAISQMTVSVHDLPEGSSATATWDNATSVMGLGIPAGATGATGLTGDTGTGIQSIVKTSTAGDVDTYTITFTDLSTTTFDVTNGKDGVDGVIGVDGLSAYQIALSNGFVGTEAQWLASLKGEKGDTGLQGIQGIQGEQGIQGIQGIAGIDGKSITSVTTSKTGKDTTITVSGTFDNSPSVFHILDGVDGTGDMLKSTYDTNNNGKVDVAEVADSVAWTGITGTPSTYPPSTHNHVVSDITDFPTLSAVATSGSYNDLSDKPTVGDGGLTEKNFTSTLKTKLETDVTQDIINESTAVKLYSGTRRSGWTKGLSGFTGAICIELVNLFGYSMDGMMSIRIKEANLSSIRLSVSGRWNASTSWGAYDAISDSAINVRFARDASKVYLIIGDVSTVWGNTRLEIDDVLTNYNAGQSLSFSVTTISSLTGYTVDATLSKRRLLSSDVGATVQGYDADLNAIAALSGTSGLLKKTATNTWSLDTNTYITGNQSITVSGDATGSGATSIALTLANSGVTAGTYKSVTVDAKGRVTNGTNPTTISGYGITDAYTKTEVDTSLSGKQETLVSGANIKTINGSSILGSGDLNITSSSDITFSKPFMGAPLFSKVSAASLSIPIGTSVKVGASVITVTGAVYTLSLNSVGVGALDTGVKTAGTDYCVYALEAGGFIISASKTNPTGYTTANSKRIGGFHYGVIPETFTAINNITSSDATKIAGINQYSFWDLKFRPICDPSGMAYIFGRWYDLYLCNVDHHTYGTSAAGKTIAGGAVTNGRNYPKIPLFYGGDGSVTYGTFTWFEASEIAKAHSKDLISYNEFVAITYGVLEASSASTADTGITQHLANFTSKFGLCMATGCQWIWSKDLGRGAGATYAWKANTEGRGSIYSDDQGPAAAIFGGYRDSTVESGSRSSVWFNYVWGTNWSFGCRYACNHLELA